jgi:iron complex transport system ATP-binding protein
VRVDAEGVTVKLGGTRVVEGAVLRAEPGTVVGLVGPNGSGKTTLLRTIFRAVRPSAGVVHVGDDDVWAISARQSARRTGVVAQHHDSDFEFSVTEVVSLGRVPHQGFRIREGAEDSLIVEASMAQAGVAGLADRWFSTLSGGERQRVLVARALAQQPAVLVLDEPTNHLDIAAQLDILGLVRSLGLTVVTALHDLNLAAGHCDQIVVLVAGEVVSTGTPLKVLTPDLIARVFGVRAHCGVHPLTGKLHVAFARPNPLSDPIH